MNITMVPHVGLLLPRLFLLVFLFIGLIFLLVKAPKAAAALIGVFVVLFVLLFYARTGSVVPTPPSPVPAASWQVQEPARAPIWSDAMEDEFEADLYPSQFKAAHSLGRRIAGYLHVGDSNMPNTPKTVRLLSSASDTRLALAVEDAMKKRMPEAMFSIMPGGSPDVAGCAVVIQSGTAPQQGELKSGQVEAVVLIDGQEQARLKVEYDAKPWVENFAGFASERPQEHYAVARSVETCTSANEARSQAMEDARQQLDRLIGARPTTPGRPPVTVTTRDVQEGGFIADTFVQSFDGSAGKIWRQAMLIDVSAPKLAWLNSRTVHVAQVERATWVKTVLSALGVLVLILVTYFFLNMATRGYYEWSLRIAGLILVVMVIVVMVSLA